MNCGVTGKHMQFQLSSSRVRGSEVQSHAWLNETLPQKQTQRNGRSFSSAAKTIPATLSNTISAGLEPSTVRNTWRGKVNTREQLPEPANQVAKLVHFLKDKHGVYANGVSTEGLNAYIKSTHNCQGEKVHNQCGRKKQ